jgi:CubicO group peptidase (beta-lactamase class C family)
VLTERILKPLNMTSSGFDFGPDVQKRMAVGRDAGNIAEILDLGWEAPSTYHHCFVNNQPQFLLCC